MSETPIAEHLPDGKEPIMQWLRRISLRKQAESKKKFDEAVQEIDSAKAVFEEIRKSLKEVRAEVAQADKIKRTPPPFQALEMQAAREAKEASTHERNAQYALRPSRPDPRAEPEAADRPSFAGGRG